MKQGPVARAARAELAKLPTSLRTSTLAAAVVDLAQRLDGEPGDRDAAGLSRELRLSLAQLHGLAAATPTDVLDVTEAGLGG